MESWQYVIDVESDEPIMLINTHIGFDEEEGQGVDGAAFQRELLQLDTMGKKRIQVWINSPGGIVMDGYNIYNAILKSNTKVDTYNVGIAASIAAVIFQAGRKRVMADYSLLMYHNPYGGDSSELKKMRESIAEMIASRTGTTLDEVLKMMDRTTWIKASEALACGFCDEIDYSKDNNVKHGNAKAMWDAGKILANKFLTTNIKKMTKVANKLGLNAEANEDSIIAAITEVENKFTKVSNDLKKMEDDYAEAKAKLAEMEDKLSEAKKKAEDADKAKADAEMDKKKSEAKNMVEGFAKAGKIKNESIEKWVNQAIVDFDGVKNLLEELPTTKKATVITVSNSASTATDAELTNVIARTMIDTQNKLSTK
jgi:ATP-dependent Clp protease protease subunit